MAVYYKVSGSNVYFTNEDKAGYSLRSTGQTASIYNHNIIIELYNGKFVLPADSNNLFFKVTNTTFNDMDCGDTSACTNISNMFGQCANLTELDFSSFNISNVSNASMLCYKCTSLKTIYAHKDFDLYHLKGLNKSYDAFTDCTKLVGGNGTAYRSDKTDGEYGVIDLPGRHGYLTLKNHWRRYDIYQKQRDFWYKVDPYIKAYDEGDELPVEVYEG